MNKKNRREQGQVMVLMAIGFVVFLGFAALAIDGGMVFSDRRHAQNASDASSLAGGGAAAMSMENSHVTYGTFNCADGRIAAAEAAAIAAAISRAASNTFTIDGDISDVNGAITDCGIDTSHGWADKFIDVTVQISSTTQTNFAQILGTSMLRNQVQAVTRIRPRSPLVYGNAIVALNPANCQGQQNGAGFHGSVDVYVDGGGIWSNGCLRGEGASLNVDVTDGGVSYVSEVTHPELFDPAAVQVPDPLPPSSYEITPPDCADPDAWNGTGSQLVNQSPLDPGLYCFTGALRLNAHDDFIGAGVTLVALDGVIWIDGNANVQLSAPTTTPDPSPAIPGILIYVPPTNDGPIQISGNSESFFTGTVLAPGADINLLGNGETDAFQVQLIGWNVEVGGTADANVTFDDSQQYSKPTMIDLWR